MLVWVVGLSYISDIILKDIELSKQLFQVGIIISIAWFALRLVKNIETRVIKQYEKEGRQIDRTTVDAVSNISKITIFVTTGLIMLQALGISIAGLLAFGGFGGIAIGFAAKDLLSNFFGAMMIFMDRPFNVGDWIRSPDKQIEGTVEKISWRQTVIRSFEKRPIYVPNSLFANIIVENPSRMTHRRINEVIGIRYDDFNKMDAITYKVREMLKTHPEIAAQQTLMVNFDKFDDSSINFFIYCFTKTKNWEKFHEVKHDVLMKIGNIIEEQKAEMAFPTSTLHIANEESVLEQKPAPKPKKKASSKTKK